MSLTGWPLLALAVIVTTLPAALAIWRPAALLSLPGVAVGAVVTGGQLAAVLVVAMLANDTFGFYPSWSDLVGQKVTFTAPSLTQSLALDSSALAALAHAPKGRGAQVKVTFTGTSPASTIRAIAYVPAAYRGPNRFLEFPVVEVLGAPSSGAAERGFFGRLDSEISAGRLPPLVAVAVQSSVPSQAMAEAIRRQLIAQLRVRSDQVAWGLLGIGPAAPAAQLVSRESPGLYGAVAKSASMTHLMRALDEIGRQLSPPLAPALMGGATVTSRRSDLKG